MDPPIIGHPIIGHPIIGHPIIGHRINRPGNKWIKFDVIKLIPKLAPCRRQFSLWQPKLLLTGYR